LYGKEVGISKAIKHNSQMKLHAKEAGWLRAERSSPRLVGQ
jgi:hypothetical protein